MILLIDSGNSALKYALVKDGQMSKMQKIDSKKQLAKKTPLEMSDIERHFARNSLKSIYISHVAGAKLKKELTEWCQLNHQIEPIFAVSNKQFNGLVNAYNPVEALGVDRWLALIAANSMYEQPICVIDAGTAVTIDAIDGKKHYIGGLILPGLGLMRQSLQKNTAAIGVISDVEPKNFFANNTQQGVMLGTALAISAVVEKFVDKLREKTDKPVNCVLTGGNADQLKTYLTRSIEHVPDLVLRGLYLWGKESDPHR